jgi:hypothetical protein
LMQLIERNFHRLWSEAWFLSCDDIWECLFLLWGQLGLIEIQWRTNLSCWYEVFST